MKKVIIKNLELRNFRGIKELHVKFNENGETTISGGNATGKSTIFNAYCWLLFGKDAQDRKDFNIRSIVDGNLLRRVDCEVVGTFSIDGEDVILRRVFKEKWVKPRGEITEVFKGNETEVFWNDVPVNVTEYQKRINGIIDDNIFKMISLPMYFPTLDWKLQREQLFQIAGTISDYEIASQKPEYKALLDKISGKSLADFKRELASKRKKLKDELEQIQPRIDQTHKLMPESSDFESIEAEINHLEKKIAELDNAISDKSDAMKLRAEQTREKQREINDLKQKQQRLLFDAQNKANDDAFKANSARQEIENKSNSLKSDLAQNERAIASHQSELDILVSRIEKREADVVKMREEWGEVNSSQYDGADVCHYCKQKLPEEMISSALKKHFDDKQAKLADIRTTGQKINAQIDNMTKYADEIKSAIKTYKNTQCEIESEIERLKKEIDEMPIVESKNITGDDLPEYVEIESKISNLEKELSGFKAGESIDVSALRDEKNKISAEIESKRNILNNKNLIERYTAEIQNLEAHGKQIAQQIADTEREEYTIQQFTKAKIDECEKRINGLFTQVTFRLFDYTIDGNEFETCVPLVNGVPFDVANTAGQVNAGLDIINALTRFHGVCAPIFIDGRESVNSIIKTESQIINLVVTNDKQLIIK